MDLMSNRYKIIVGLLLILGFGTLLLPVNSHAGRNILTNFSFDDCDPFEARAIVMDVFPNKQQLIAAEQTIYVVDMPIGDQRLITEITDPNGRHLDLGSIRQGQWVHIKGFKHIDGGVVASWVQKIDPPENKKPVLRKLSVEKPGYRRMNSKRAEVIRK